MSPIATTAACRTDSLGSSSACVNRPITSLVTGGFTRPMAKTDASRTSAVGSCKRGSIGSTARGSPILPRDSTAVRRISGPSSRSNSSRTETVRSLEEDGESWTQPIRRQNDREREHPKKFSVVTLALGVLRGQINLWPYRSIAGIPSGQSLSQLG